MTRWRVGLVGAVALALTAGSITAWAAGPVTILVNVGPLGEGNNASFDSAISADGRFVAFISDASNLVPGVTGQQVYVRDLTLLRSLSVSAPLGRLTAST
jgi:hypothetical protein